ncbi:glycosyl hydrolase 5 family protein-like [Andrographis paniculata]|uniref:glycosyl hydrolase 5 family protein-like n=1 Tax=Andrographis paniculata TaxID=175694 RepID=UPI0021E8178A|nr:glycosyl hydrolase 5 family protein-like [Andrographis paniculata]
MKEGRKKAIFLFLLLQIHTLCNSTSLSTKTRWIIDEKSRKRVKLTCVNWISHMEPMIAEGLEKKPVSYIASQIAANGFNCVRFTWPTFMFTRSNYSALTVSQSLDKFNLAAAKSGIGKNNPQFLNMTVVDVHEAVVDELRKRKTMVVLDNHVSMPSWCCSSGDGNGFFGDSHFDPNEWLQGLSIVARKYKNNAAVIGMSLRNELRGRKQKMEDWYKYMKRGAEAVHKENPKVLVIVSGLSSDTKLDFLKNKPLGANVGNKLVYESHWYGFQTPAEKWVGQTNRQCAVEIQRARNNYLFLTTTGPGPFPVMMTEFGIDQRSTNEVDNRFVSCFLAVAAEYDLDWALWSFQGSYILRQGRVGIEEFYGVMNFNWDAPRNPSFLNRLKFVRQINQVPKRSIPSYRLFHPQSGECVGIGKKKRVRLGSCKTASRWEKHEEGGPIKLWGKGLCVGVVGEGAGAGVAEDCGCDDIGSRWKSVSASGLHLGAQHGRVGGGYLCLERNGSDAALVTRKCLCVGDDLRDFPQCADDPQLQWFKFVPVNA